jgi:transposase
MMGTKTRSKKSTKTPSALPVLRPRAAGIDLGAKRHWVCGPPLEDGQPNVRDFGTTTDELNAMADWLLAQEVDSVAMESTYVYWIPAYEVLQARGVEVLLVNARELHSVAGRKSDVSDCQWIRTLHSCGLLRGSFRPTEAITRLRSLQRQAANLVAERTRYVQWMQQALDQMNVQVHRAVSDLTGTTGMAIVRAIVAGERSPQRLAAHRDPRCRSSVEQIARYLTGHWREDHLFNLASALRLYDAVSREIETYEQRLVADIQALQAPERRDAAVPPHANPTKEKAIRARGHHELRTTLWRFAGADLMGIEGIGPNVARVILTEVGPDLSAFPTESRWVSWLRVCPYTPTSGGKPVKKRRNGLGATRIAEALRMAAANLARSKTALGAAFRRYARTKSKQVAVLAIARKLAQLVYRMLVYGQTYVDIGEAAYEAQYQRRRLASLQENARSLGFSLVPSPTT